MRIQHELDEIEGGVYGDVRGYYASVVSHGIVAAPTALLQVHAMTQLVALDDAEICQVRDQVAKIPLDLRQRFQATYAVWQQTWTSVALSSAPAARANSTEFAKLIALGPPILPLLMEKLTDPDEFFALVAVDRFLAPELRARPSFGDESVLLGEQGRAIETVRRWLRIVS